MELKTHIPSYLTIHSNHALVSCDGQQSTLYHFHQLRNLYCYYPHRHGEELDECADSSLTCAVMEQLSRKQLRRSRDALDLRSLGILLGFWHFPEQVKVGTSPKSSTRSSGPGGRAESGDENMDFWDGKYTLQRNREESQCSWREKGKWARLTLEIVVMDPYRRRTVPDSYGATAIDRADGNVIRRAVWCLKFKEETARRGTGKAKG